MAKITEEELKALLSGEIAAAKLYDNTELSKNRSEAIEYYRGEMRDVPPMANRSKATSNDVADTIGWMLPGIIRVFTASERMAMCEPVKPGDEEVADQATDYLNHVFWKDNKGYRILWDATHDSLLQKNGIVKHWWDDTEECDYSEHSGLTLDQITMMQEDQGVEIVAQKQGEPQMVPVLDPMTGQEVYTEIETFDVKVKRVTMNGRLKLQCVKPEAFLMDKDAIFIDEARFVCHREEVTRSDLVEMGFDKNIVASLPADRTFADTNEALARQDYVLSNWNKHEATQLVELYECYIRVDTDGDGIAETVRAYYAGTGGAGELLDWEVWEDDVPFSDIPCEPVPHRWDARSVADETMDIQRIKTVLTRQMLDNTYASNLPMLQAEEGSVLNPERLVNPAFGAVIWRKKNTMATSPVTPFEIPFVADKTLTILQHMDTVKEMRTGVSRSTMALDPQTLQNQTATANQNQKDSAYSQVELIARNQAELGWTRVFRQMLKLLVKHQDRPRTIRLRDEWVDMDPRSWNADMDITINVGLGTGSRDRDMAMLEKVAVSQAMLTQQFVANGMMDEAVDMLPRLVTTLTKQAESSGLRMAEEFYPEFDEEKIVQLKEAAKARAEQPDPKVIEAQKKIELQQMEGQAKLQLEASKGEQKLMLEQQKQQGEFELKYAQMQQELLLKREQLAAELAMERELRIMEMGVKEKEGFYKPQPKVSTSKVNMGGKPG